MNLDDIIFKEADKSIDLAFDTKKWAASMGINLVRNQIEIVDHICKPSSKYTVVLASRSAGKTYSVSLAAIRMCLSKAKYGVMIFAPRQDQATRVTTEIAKICKLSYLDKEVDWRRSTNSKVVFKNMSEIIAMSASEKTEMEGWHADLGIIDESHRVSDMVFIKRIVPMFKSSDNPKLVKIGISLYKNHFYDSFISESWDKLIYPWYKCDWLYRSELVDVNGEKIPKSVLDDMPISYKRNRWPNNPELHYPSVNKFSEEDFDTQYEMKWVDDINLFLRTEEDQRRLIGTHNIQERGIEGGEYYFGLDCAGGAEISTGNARDYTALTIIQKLPTGEKRVVAAYEWQGDIVDQINEIIAIVHPKTGIFKCKKGVCDYGNLGSAIADFLNKMQLPVIGIKYKATDSLVGKNYKNSLFDQMIFELRNDKFNYPAQDYIYTHPVLKKHIDEWIALERRKTGGINDAISAPVNGSTHDDGPNSCFTGDTEVRLVNGSTIKISELVENMSKHSVLSYDPLTGEFVEGYINAAHVKTARRLLQISFSNRTKVVCTYNHEFMLNDGRYIRADQLAEGNVVKSKTRAELKITKIIRYPGPQTVYDIEIDNYHNYVLASGAVVHNCCLAIWAAERGEDVKDSVDVTSVLKLPKMLIGPHSARHRLPGGGGGTTSRYL